MLTVKEVAQQLGVSPGLVYREISCGRLRCHRFGKRTYRISEADVREYIATCLRPLERVETPLREDRRREAKVNCDGFRHIDVSRLLSRQT